MPIISAALIARVDRDEDRVNLVAQADLALMLGNRASCVELISKLYELLDRHSARGAGGGLNLAATGDSR